MQTEGLNNLVGMKPGRTGIVGIALFCLVVYLPGFFALPAVDWDEARVAQSSRQMYESVALPAGQRQVQPGGKHSGGLVVPMLQNGPWLAAPPFIQWAQAASAAVFSRGNPYRDDIWMYRVPSLIGAVCVVVLTRKIATLMFDAGAGGLAAVFVAVCPLIGWEARQAQADMVLTAWTAWAMLQLWRVYAWGRVGSTGTVVAAERPGIRAAVFFWIAMAGGLMTKGPITPLIVALTALGLCIAGRRWRWLLDLKPLLAVPVLGIAIGPWAYAVSRQVGLSTYLEAIVRETSGIGQLGRWGAPGYSLLLMPLLLWPGSILTGLGIFVAWILARGVRGSGAWRDGHPSYLYLIAWIVPSWILLELINAKVPCATMPVYPALAILSARAVLAAEAKALTGVQSGFAKGWYVLWLVLGAGLIFAAIGGMVTCIAMFSASVAGKVGLSIVLLVSAGVMLSLLKASWSGILHGKFARASVGAVLAMVVFWLVAPKMILPRVLGLSEAIGAELIRIDPGAGRPVASVGYQEDSLVFATRGRLERLEAAGVSAWLSAHPDGLLVREREEVIIDGPKRIELGSATGLNISKGRAQLIAIEEAAR